MHPPGLGPGAGNLLGYQAARVAGSGIWLRSDRGVTTGATFRWKDFGGANTGNDATQATANLQPTYQATGGGGFGKTPYILCPGGAGNVRLLGSKTFPNQPLHLFVSGRCTQQTTTAYLFDAGNNKNAVFQNGGALTTIYYDGTTQAGPTLTLNQDFVYEVFFSGAASFARLNGGVKLTGNPGTTAMTDSYCVGNFFGGGDAWGGWIYEVASFTIQLSDAAALVQRRSMYGFGGMTGAAYA